MFQLLLQYGSEVNIRQPRERIRILDKYGAVEQIYRLENHIDVFQMLVSVVGVFNLKDIEIESSIPDNMKVTLCGEGSIPRRLKHQARLQIRRQLKVHIPDKIELLPLPRLIKDYLLYQVWDDYWMVQTTLRTEKCLLLIDRPNLSTTQENITCTWFCRKGLVSCVWKLHPASAVWISWGVALNGAVSWLLLFSWLCIWFLVLY